jgi:pimeloyl-ACP methyl ester carboxylesterase
MMRRCLQWILGTLFVVALSVAVDLWLRPVEFFQTQSEFRLLLTGAESHTITLPLYRVRVHYYALGPRSGPPVVLVHGLGGRAEDWVHLAPYFVRAGYRVYLPDLVGYGQSQKPEVFSYSIRDEEGVVVAFLDALGLKQADLGGWSMGGWIVQWVAFEHPERVRKLMLFDSAGLALKPDWNAALFTPTTARELSQLNDLLMPQAPSVPGFVAKDILRSSSQHAWIIRRALASMLTGRDATNTLLPTLKMPVFTAWGAMDRITPLSECETMHQLIPGSQLSVIRGCGHLAPSMCAPQIGPDVVAFLGR